VVALGLRNDVYRRPMKRALEKVGLGPGWTCADLGAGGGDVSISLAKIVGETGRVYAVDIDPKARDDVAAKAATYSQVVAITQAGEDLLLPEQVDLVLCRFLLIHVTDPLLVVKRMARAAKQGGWVVLQEPVTSAGRIGGVPLKMPDAKHPDLGAELPALAVKAGLTVIEAWAESEAGIGPGPVASYLESLTEVDPGEEPILLPPLVSVVARKL